MAAAVAASLLLLHLQSMAAFAGALKSRAGGLRGRGEPEGRESRVMAHAESAIQPRGARRHPCSSPRGMRGATWVSHAHTHTLMRASRCSSRRMVAEMEAGS